MNYRHLFSAITLLGTFALFTCSVSAQDITVNYEYTQKPQVDFSPMPKGTLKLSTFSDARGADMSAMIGSFHSSDAVSSIVHDALSQAFVAGGAKLVESDQSLTLSGEVTEASVTDKDGAFDVIIRTHVTLQSGGRTPYDSVIFGRATGDTPEDATRAALDKLVNSLIWDDYFLNEVI
jgi:hypothetical protein